jgi:uncharacterized membrane protein
MSQVTLYCSLFAMTGLMFIGLGVPLIQRRIPPNRFYGFRTTKTLSNPKIWYEVNHISGNDLLVAGALITISSLTMLFLAQSWRPDYVALTLLAVMVLSLSGAAWHGFRVSSRM